MVSSADTLLIVGVWSAGSMMLTRGFGIYVNDRDVCEPRRDVCEEPSGVKLWYGWLKTDTYLLFCEVAGLSTWLLFLTLPIGLVVAYSLFEFPNIVPGSSIF